jgi:hypothetical protein
MSEVIDDGLWTRKDVAKAYCIHWKNVAKFVTEGRIPKPLEGWEGDARWLKSECVAHMRAMRKRDEKEQAA